MKRVILCVVGALMVTVLAACAPTKDTQPKAQDNVQTVPEELLETTGNAADKVPDPNAPVMEPVAIYAVSEGGDSLTQHMDGVETVDPQVLADKLAEYGVLEQGVQVINFTTEGEETNEQAGPGASAEKMASSAVLDLSAAPAGDNKDQISSAIANTFIDNMSVKKIDILVNGTPYAEGLEYTENYQAAKEK